MKSLTLSLICLLSTLAVHSQELKTEISKRKLVLSEFTKGTLNYEIDLGDSKHTSVIIKVKLIEGKMKSPIHIKGDSTFTQSTIGVKTVTIRHKKRLLMRFNQKLNEYGLPKATPVRVTSKSSGGSTTSTKVSST